jgi:hypothetical protein
MSLSLDTEEPLLSEAPTGQDENDTANSAHGSRALRAEEAGESGRRLLSVASMRDYTPEEAMDNLKEHGIMTLGSMTVMDLPFKEALGGDGDDLLTTGADSIHDFDWRSYWQQLLKGVPISQKRKKGWQTEVNVLSRVVVVEGATQPREKGLLSQVIKRFQVSGDSSIFTIPAVEAVITYKWNAFARRLLRMQFLLYLVWLFSFTGFIWAIQDENYDDSLPELLSKGRGKLSVCLEVLALVVMAPFIWIEARTLSAYGIWQWANLWNVLDSCTYVLQILITVAHLQRSMFGTHWMSVVLATQCLLLWAKMQYYSRVFQSTSTSFVDTLKAVLYDVRYFLCFLVLTFYSFAAAFHILLRRDQEKIEAFSTFFHTIGSVFTLAVGGPDMEPLWNSSVPVASTVLCIVCTLVITVIFLNLLIAIMSDSYSRIMDNEENRFRCNQAAMIDELEETIPSWMYDNKRWSPKYIHFLQREDDAAECEGRAEAPATLEQLQKRIMRLEALVAGSEGRILDAIAKTNSGQQQQVDANIRDQDSKGGLTGLLFGR